MTLLLPAHPGSASERADSTRSMLCMPIRAAHGIDATLNPKIVGVVQCINKLGDLHITNGAVDAPGFSTQVTHGLHPTSTVCPTPSWPATRVHGCRLALVDCVQDESDLRDLARGLGPIVQNARPAKEKKAGRTGGLGESWCDNLKKLQAASIFDVVANTLDRARELVGADRAALFFVDQARGELWSRFSEETPFIRIKIGKGIAGSVAATGEPIDVGDAYRDERFNRRVDMVTGYRTRQVVCVPIKSQLGRVVAVLQCINKFGPHDATFTFDDRRKLEEFAFQISGVLDAKGREVEDVARAERAADSGDTRVQPGSTRSTSIFANLVDLLASDAVLAGAETETVAGQHRHALNAIGALCAEGDANRDAIVRAGGVAPIAELLTPLPWRDDATILAALRAFASLTRSPLANQELNGAGGWRVLLPIAAKAVAPSFFRSPTATSAKPSHDVRERATHAMRALANVATNVGIATSLLLDLGALELALSPLSRPPPLKQQDEAQGANPLLAASAQPPQPTIVGFYLNHSQMERGTAGIEEAAAESWISDLQAHAARLLGCLAYAAVVSTSDGSGSGSGGGAASEGNTPKLARAAALKLSSPRVASTLIDHCAALSGANLRVLGQAEALGSYHTNESVPVCAVALADLVEALPYFRLQACSVDGITVVQSFYRYTGVSRPRVREQLMRLIAGAMRERDNQRMMLGQLRSHDPQDEAFLAMSTHEQKSVLQNQRDQFAMGRELQRIVGGLIRTRPRPPSLATHHAIMLETLTKEPLNHQCLNMCPRRTAHLAAGASSPSLPVGPGWPMPRALPRA